MAIIGRFNNKKEKPLEEKLAIIGERYLRKVLSFQQRDFEETLAIKNYNFEEKEIDSMIKDIFKENKIPEEDGPLYNMILAHNRNDPIKSYSDMKVMIISNALDDYAQLNKLNKENKSHYSIDDCIRTTYTKVSKEDFIDNYKKEHMSEYQYGSYDDLLSQAMLSKFEAVVKRADYDKAKGSNPFQFGIIRDVNGDLAMLDKSNLMYHEKNFYSFYKIKEYMIERKSINQEKEVFVDKNTGIQRS